MCNINKKLSKDIKEISGYKVVFKDVYDESIRYRGVYSGAEVNIGSMEPKSNDINGFPYEPSEGPYNKNMIGRVSCFKSLLYAKLVYKRFDQHLYYPLPTRVPIILKITIKDGLMEGDAPGIISKTSKAVTYAGKKIVSLEEVKF